MKRRLILITLLAIVAVMLGIPLVATIVGQARAAALLKFNGQDLVLMAGEEFVSLVKRKDDEIAELRARLEVKHKAECNLL